MTWLTEAIIQGITAFAATNVDDIAILIFLFSQVNQTFRIRHIIMGQYLGFMVILIASLPGVLGGAIIPKMWLGLLGFLPIAIGISQLFDQVFKARKAEQDEAENIILPSRVNQLTSFISPQTYSVAAITFANGGDNIGIYIPLFANSKPPELLVILLVFFILIGVWCYSSYLLSRHPLIASFLTRHGKRFVPFVLIGLGIFILIESQTYKLISIN